MTLQTEQQSRQAYDLIQSAFGEGRELVREYPLVFDPSFQGSLVGLEKDGEVISACSVLPRDMVMNGWLLRMGLIGSVITREDHRGQGHGEGLLERAEDVLVSQGAVFSMLWADDPGFYERRGFVPVGMEVDYKITLDQAAKLPEAVGVRFLQSTDHDSIHGLYTQHSHRCDRTLAETSALLSGPGITGIVMEVERQVVGYILMGRGGDLQGVVHEWGGETQAVLACLRGMLENLPTECPGIYLMCPVTSVDMRKTLLDLEVPALEGILGMARVIDMSAMSQLFQRFGSPKLEVESRSQSLVLSGPEGSIELDKKQCLLACMPPQGNRTVIETVENQIGLSFDGLPLFPFAWGLDSI